MTNKQHSYEKRVVAFIDILGFREHINKTTTNPSHFKKIGSVLNYIYDLKKENDDGTLSLKSLGYEVTIFSDSIVLSYPANISGSLFYLLLDIINIQLEMLSKGIIMRGGVTVGDLYHNDNIVYGPAMNAAYDLESKVAIYPRVLVSKDAIETALKYTVNSPEEDFEYISELLKTDFDNQYFVDFMKEHGEVDEITDYFDALKTIKEVIENSVTTYKQQPTILVKYEWLKNYYNSTLSSHFKNIEELLIE